MAEAVTALDYRGNITIPVETASEASVAAPGAGATVASISLVPGTYNIGWTVALTAGTPAAGDANNFGLYVGGVLQEQSATPGALGSWPQQQVEITVAATTTIAVKAVGAGTAGVTYAAELSAVPVEVTDPTGQLQPPNTVRVNGSVVTLGSGQAVTMAGFDATGDQSECQLGTGTGANIPAGTTNFGFVDTTYTLTPAQVAAGSLMGA